MPILNAARNYLKTHAVARKMLQGGIAGGASTAIILPIDTTSDVQKQWRNTPNNPELNEISHSFLSTAKELARPKVRKDAEGGIKPFYVGAGGKLLKVAPAMSLTFAAENLIEKGILK